MEDCNPMGNDRFSVQLWMFLTFHVFFYLDMHVHKRKPSYLLFKMFFLFGMAMETQPHH